MHSVTCTVKSFVEPTTPEEAIQPTQVSFAPWNSLHSLSILLPWGPESQFQPAAFFDVVQHLRFTHLVHGSQSSQVPHQVTCHNMRRTDSKTANNLLIYLYYVTSQATNLVTISNMYSTNFAKAFAGHDVKRCGTVYHDIRYVLSCTQECSRKEVRIHMNTLNSSENVMNRLIVFYCGRVESMWCHAAVCLRWSRARHARSLWMQMPCLWHFSKLPCQIVVSPPSDKIHGILVLVWKWLKHTGIVWHLAILPVKHEGTRKCMNLDVLIISCLHTSYYYGRSHVINNVDHRRNMVHSGSFVQPRLVWSRRWNVVFQLSTALKFKCVERYSWGICTIPQHSWDVNEYCTVLQNYAISKYLTITSGRKLFAFKQWAGNISG